MVGLASGHPVSVRTALSALGLCPVRKDRLAEPDLWSDMAGVALGSSTSASPRTPVQSESTGSGAPAEAARCGGGRARRLLPRPVRAQ